MGITNIPLTITNIKNPKYKVQGKFLVDTGATYTVVPKEFVKKLKLKPVKTQEFSLADGTTIKRKLSYAFVEINGDKAPSTIVIGEKGDSPILGVFTLEGMGLMIDPFKRKLRPMKLMLA